jgi:hypothetical protein
VSREARVRYNAKKDYVAQKLSRLALQSVELQGVGTSLLAALEEASIHSIADLEQVPYKNIAGIGAERDSALLKVFGHWQARAVNDFLELGRPELNRRTHGGLYAAVEDDAAEARQHERKVRALEVRKKELLRRAKDAGLGDAREVETARKRGRVRKASPRSTEEACPQCGGTLRGRRGKYGAFTGCSNYPRCKYTRGGRYPSE